MLGLPGLLFDVSLFLIRKKFKKRCVGGKVKLWGKNLNIKKNPFLKNKEFSKFP